VYVENEINFFISEFNKLYGDFVRLRHVQVVSYESDVGADRWLIEVFADIKQKRLRYSDVVDVGDSDDLTTVKYRLLT